MIRVGSVILLVVTLGGWSNAFAGEADDLQNMIDRARQGAKDLEALDEHKAVTDEITFLRVWLDEAWKQRSQQHYDEVRAVLDRCDAQADMVRQRIVASQLSAQAAEREKALKRTRAKIDETKKAIEAATIQKAALGAKGRK